MDYPPEYPPRHRVTSSNVSRLTSPTRYRVTSSTLSRSASACQLRRRPLSSRTNSNYTAASSGRVYKPKHTKVEGSKTSIDRLSLFLERVADESGDSFCSATHKATAKLSRIYLRLIEMISGSRSGLPHGHVLVKKNKILTFEEQRILKEECSNILDKAGYISPRKLQAWFTPVMMSAVRDLILWDETHPPDYVTQHGYRDFAGITAEVTSAGTMKLMIPCNKDEIVPYCDQYEDDEPRQAVLNVTLVPTLKTLHWNWPVGTHLQHAYPKMPPYGRNGQLYIKTIEECHDDGGSLFLLEPSGADIRMSHPILGSKFRGRAWAVSFYPANVILYKSLFDLKLVIMSCILWTMKRKLMHVRNLADFVLRVLDSLRIVAQQRFCPCFLMPNVNILKDIRIEDAKRISYDIAMLQSRMMTDPSQILTYIGYYQN